MFWLAQPHNSSSVKVLSWFLKFRTETNFFLNEDCPQPTIYWTLNDFGLAFASYLTTSFFPSTLPSFLPSIFTRGYVFIDSRERGRERKRERNIDVRQKHWLVASRMCANQESTPKHRYVPRPGIEPATFWGMGHHSNQLSHLARAWQCFLMNST